MCGVVVVVGCVWRFAIRLHLLLDVLKTGPQMILFPFQDPCKESNNGTAGTRSPWQAWLLLASALAAGIGFPLDANRQPCISIHDSVQQRN